MKTNNIVHFENMDDDDREIALIGEKIYVHEGLLCPGCALDTIQEETRGFERISFCTHCEYFASIPME
jgi:hypothetical protein